MVGCGGMAGQTARMPVGRGRGAPTFSPPFFSILSKYAFVIEDFKGEIKHFKVEIEHLEGEIKYLEGEIKYCGG